MNTECIEGITAELSEVGWGGGAVGGGGGGGDSTEVKMCTYKGNFSPSGRLG